MRFVSCLREHMNNNDMKIAIVGGGLAGIGAIKMLKEEGFEPVCFEKMDTFAGTWCYRKESEIGVGSIMRTTVFNQSKELGAISNILPPKEFKNFLKHSDVYESCVVSSDLLDFRRHIRLSSEVTCVKRSIDYEQTGRWVVSVKDRVTGVETTDTYDAVIICVGHFNRPKMPTYPNQEIFKGKIMHSHSLKEITDYKDQNLVVVGMGCSGLDAAVETSNIAKQVYLSTRSGAHVLNRVGSHGYPYDYFLIRRINTVALNFPQKISSWLYRKLYFDPWFDEKLYPVKPKHDVLSKDPVINDFIGSKLLSGMVIQKRDIKQFTENGVIFEGEDDETPADTVIMATGYTWAFPFLEDGIVVKENDGRINLYKCMFPPHLKHNTLMFIGFIMPFGPGIPLGEMQCRWAAKLLAGKAKLPSEDVMMKEITKRHQRNLKRYIPNDKMSIRVDYVQYLDDIAKEVGCKPNFLKIFFTDPVLFYKLWLGPFLPYQYRLDGPHKWEGARDAIMTVEERIAYPLGQTKYSSLSIASNPLIMILLLIPSLFFSVFMSCYI